MISSRGIDFVKWASLTTEIISRYGIIPKPSSEDRWQEWGNLVVSLPAIATVAPPQPRLFKTWGEWATRFNESVLLLGDV